MTPRESFDEGPPIDPLDALLNDLAHLAPTSPITSPKMGELTTSPTHPSSTKGGRGESRSMGELDLAHELAQQLGMCPHHAGIIATRAKRLEHAVRHPGHGTKALRRLAAQLASQHCEWFAQHDDTPLTRERPLP